MDQALPPRPSVSMAERAQAVGKPGGTSAWLVVDQDLIDGFADVTGDHAFIHVDPVRAAETRFGGTIAHGLLTLSCLPLLMQTATPRISDCRIGVNYGFDRVRFLMPVPTGSRIRGRFDLAELRETKPKFFLLNYDVTVEVEGLAKPALTASWLVGQWTT